MRRAPAGYPDGLTQSSDLLFHLADGYQMVESRTAEQRMKTPLSLSLLSLEQPETDIFIQRRPVIHRRLEILMVITSGNIDRLSFTI